LVLAAGHPLNVIVLNVCPMREITTTPRPSSGTMKSDLRSRA
jgi:hypothetical protein